MKLTNSRDTGPGRSPALRIAGDSCDAFQVVRGCSDATRDNGCRRKIPLRVSTALLRLFFQREKEVRRIINNADNLGLRRTPEQAQLCNRFRYDPPSWAERLVIHALVSLAHEQGELRNHPWAKQGRPVLDGEGAKRVQISYPGISEIARIVGYTPGTDGRIASRHRTPLKNALDRLCNQPRVIAIPVLVSTDGDYVKDIHLDEGVLVRPSDNDRFDLHSALVASHLYSWIPVDGLAAKYEDARRRINCGRMRNEMATCNQYLRWLAISNSAQATKRGGSARVFEAKVKNDRLVHTIGLTSLVKDRRRRDIVARVDDALKFCHEMGSLESCILENGVWRLNLHNPDVGIPRKHKNTSAAAASAQPQAA